MCLAWHQVVEANPCLKYIQLIVLPWSGAFTVTYRKDADRVRYARLPHASEHHVGPSGRRQTCWPVEAVACVGCSGMQGGTCGQQRYSYGDGKGPASAVIGPFSVGTRCLDGRLAASSYVTRGAMGCDLMGMRGGGASQ